MSIAKIAERQHGVISGHAALPSEGRWLAAVLAVGWSSRGEAGPVLDHWGAAVSHCSAGTLWGFLPETGQPVDVIVLGKGGRAKRHGIRVHRSLTLMPVDVTLRRGIPVTTAARTISDLRLATLEGSPGALFTRTKKGDPPGRRARYPGR